ncbi:bifunctional DNA-formamidopyrimidine glycosylase/DNA-(apurinic or apyrimidinic site) lyase [Desulfococcaceae bacterium HSG9]|nr:bifunctional DNA-formamidopyrimidine glycosylase/DNA-(apurinic or apyrimidinic site) lyase [Desulfococcaceae bacterium HSG9]
MPELPEVQTLVDDLNDAEVCGAVIKSARVFWHKTIADMEPRAFCHLIAGKQVITIYRRAKYIIFDLTDGWHLLIHLRMSGHLQIASPESPRTKHQHVILELNDLRQLRFTDPRKFGRFFMVSDALPILSRLGPEPLDKQFTAHLLGLQLLPRRRMLKPLLLDQTVIAGLGNIYVDEALWQARLHPHNLGSELNMTQIRSLHRAIRKVLRLGLHNKGTTLGRGQTTFYSLGERQGRNRNHLKVFRRTGLPCMRCRTPIERLIVGQRSTHICPRCQTV